MSTKVLVFESDAAFGAELRTELGKLGCATTVVDDGNAGLLTASNEKPDLILLSIELPRMNGFSVCNKLKKDAALRDVPLIIMSSESSDETFEQHRKLRTRAEDYVHKPIAFGELLQHIQAFVSLGGSPNGEGEVAIVIDDEIEIGATDYLLEDDSFSVTAAGSATSPLSAEPSAHGAESIDADVDAFAESAFGRLTGLEALSPPSPPAVERHSGNGAAEPAQAPPRSAPPSPPRRTPTGPLPLRGPSSRPPTTVDIVEYDRLRGELVEARDRAVEIERAFQETQAEAEKLRLDAREAERLSAEVDELRAKIASTGKAGSISSREFLDLREALNRKDKEILALKENLSRKDKEFVGLHDQQLAFERTKSDLEDRMLAMERELTETREGTESLLAESGTARRASEEAKARLEKLRAESELKERQLMEARARHLDELGARDARLATIRAELDQILANERAENARAVDESERRRVAELEGQHREHAIELGAVREQVQRDAEEASHARSSEVAREHDERLLELRSAHEAALAKRFARRRRRRQLKRWRRHTRNAPNRSRPSKPTVTHALRRQRRKPRAS